MPAHIARWWLWTCLTAVGASVAVMLGYGTVLWRQDATGLALAVVALYVACTAWLGWKVRAGDRDYRFVGHIAKVMSYLGILGTFIGLAIAFQAMGNLPADGSIPPTFKVEFIRGVMSKFHASIVGLVGFLCLEMQIRILEVGDERAV